MSKSLRMLMLVVVVAFVAIGSVYAHEHRTVGEYEIVFGWRVEPATVGSFNGPEIIITEAHSEEAEATPEAEHVEGANHNEETETVPVEGAEATLTLEVSFGDVTRVVPLRAAFRDPGHYIADLMPTRPGDYVFHLTGVIDQTPIDETFNSAVDSYSTVEPVEDIQFPDPFPSTFELLARIEALEAQVAGMSGG